MAQVDQKNQLSGMTTGNRGDFTGWIIHGNDYEIPWGNSCWWTNDESLGNHWETYWAD